MDNRETIKLRIFPRSICGEVVMDNLHQLATVGPYVVGYSGPYEIRCIEYRPEIDPSSIVMIFDPVTLYNRRGRPVEFSDFILMVGKHIQYPIYKIFEKMRDTNRGEELKEASEVLQMIYEVNNTIKEEQYR